MTSAYEEARLARMRENAAAMRELGLASAVAAAAPPSSSSSATSHPQHRHQHHTKPRDKDTGGPGENVRVLRPRDSLAHTAPTHPDHPNMPQRKRTRRTSSSSSRSSSSSSSSSHPRPSRAKPRSVDLREFAESSGSSSSSEDDEYDDDESDKDEGDGYDYSGDDAGEGERRDWRGARRQRRRGEWYDAEQVAALGSCRRRYAFVAMPKVADAVHGTTCHQCRQRTRDAKTRCAHCAAPQGVLCGPCLQVRYGENILEVVRGGRTDPAWRCPACRRLCNCDACRAAAGLAPVGDVAVPPGYASVAHWLVLTHSHASAPPATH